ncbi:MAG: hypothetical protein IPP90_01045 [Gemmatimonadaceae bacterium]|nr:hypothetical protein [Gemmatimonadaceae bacterium]
MTGMLQFVRSSPEVLRPSRNPMLLDFILHKLMRPATPLLLMLAGACYVSALWSWRPLAVAKLAVVVAALAIVVTGLALVAPRWMAPRLAALGFAGRLIFMPLRAISRALRADWDVWMPAKGMTTKLPGT